LNIIVIKSGKDNRRSVLVKKEGGDLCNRYGGYDISPVVSLLYSVILSALSTVIFLRTDEKRNINEGLRDRSENPAEALCLASGGVEANSPDSRRGYHYS
jgi:hypothetical protein